MKKCTLALILILTSGAVFSDTISAGTLIRDVRVWDGISDQPTNRQNVLIEGNLITALDHPAGNTTGVRIIDGGGRILMPGIIDAHVHLASPLSRVDSRRQDPGYVAAHSLKIANMLLMRGWTTVRDLGGPAQGIAKAIDEGVATGPRIFPSAAYISQTSGHGDSRLPNDPHPNLGGYTDRFETRYALIADGPSEVQRAVRESLRLGATQIKLMAGGGISSDNDPLDTVQYSLEELQAAVEAAADWHTYVAVHAYTDEAVNRALDAGVKVIEHGHLLTKPTLRRIKDEGAFLSSQSFGFVRSLDLDVSTSGGRKAEQVMSGVDSLMNTAKEIGLPVAFGTDAFGSPRTYEIAVKEFTYRQRWFSSLEILRQATSENAKLLELSGPRNPYREGPLGIIAIGAYADLLIVDGDPLANASLLEDHENNIRLVMKDGVIYKNTISEPGETGTP